jgi:hypothetical protein
VGALLAALDPLVGPLSVRLEPFPPEVAALDGGGVVRDCGRLERAVGPRPRTPLAIGLAATLAAARSDDTRPAAAPGSNGPPPARTRRPPERERVPIDAAGVTLSERSSP